MNVRIQTKSRLSNHLSLAPIIGMLLLVSVGCSSADSSSTDQPTTAPIESEASPATAETVEQPAQEMIEPEASPVTPLATTTSEGQIPAGWLTHTSEQCGVTTSYPPEMQVTSQGDGSYLFEYKLENPEEGARNFIYVSTVDQDFDSMGEEIVYNYDAAEVEILLNMQVGESKAVRDLPDAAPWTYQRMADTMIGGHVAQTYENLQPWEFPSGTKEIRNLLSLNGCTLLIGGYLDSTVSDQMGAVSEELFYQIVATIQLMS